VRKNLTLSLDEQVLRAARRLALDRGTSVNEMVREYLTKLVGEGDRRAAALRDLENLWRGSKFRLVGGITWTRDELHDRKRS
jgi:hypothetical protein